MMGPDGPIPEEWLPGMALAGALSAAHHELDGEDVDRVIRELVKRGFHLVKLPSPEPPERAESND